MFVKYDDLQGKIVLLTGATRGIGRSIALALAKQGVHVVFNYRAASLQNALKLKEEIESLGSKATPLQFDMTNSAEMKVAIDEFLKNNGPISGLINNAGISKDQLLMRLKDEEIVSVIETNLLGAMRTTQILTRNFLKATDVSIINVSSIVGLMGNAGQSAYAASKAGLIGFTKSVAKELASKNVRCNAICPGFIETEMTSTLDEKLQTTYLENIPLKRFGKPEEVAELTCFLLSKASSYITGETIKIDGGIYI